MTKASLSSPLASVERHHQLVLSWYHHQPESHQQSFKNVSSCRQRSGHIDHTPDLPGSGTKVPLSIWEFSLLSLIHEFQQRPDQHNHNWGCAVYCVQLCKSRYAWILLADIVIRGTQANFCLHHHLLDYHHYFARPSSELQLKRAFFKLQLQRIIFQQLQLK